MIELSESLAWWGFFGTLALILWFCFLFGTLAILQTFWPRLHVIRKRHDHHYVTFHYKSEPTDPEPAAAAVSAEPGTRHDPGPPFRHGRKPS